MTRRREILAGAVLASVGILFAVLLLERLLSSDPRPDADELVRSGLLERDGQPDELWFAHALIQEVAYGSLLKRRRRELHALAAGAIEELWVERIDEYLGILAHHHRGAGDPSAPFRWPSSSWPSTPSRSRCTARSCACTPSSGSGARRCASTSTA